MLDVKTQKADAEGVPAVMVRANKDGVTIIAEKIVVLHNPFRSKDER